MHVSDAFLSLAISLGLGLLVGMQRQRSKSLLGGIRTFALITVFGSVCALIARASGSHWIVAAGMAGVIASFVIGTMYALRNAAGSPGITTEIAMVVMFGVGALLVYGPLEVAVVIGAGVAILLQAKPILHTLVAKLGDEDVRAIMQFVLVTLVILPVVPNETFGPYDVLNPRNIWLMVALVTGMSLAGYLLYRVVGKTVGVALAGVLGGLISSTATTVSYSRRARGAAGSADLSAYVAVIMIAGTIVFGRIMVEISAVAPSLVPVAAGPISAVAGVSGVLALAAWLRASRDKNGLSEQKNPTELKSALVFAGLYALMLLAVAAAKVNLGDSGLYAVAAVSGLVEMDSITLSVSRMVQHEGLATDTAWRCIVIGSIANMVAKLSIIGAMGGVRLLKAVAPLFCIQIAGGLAVVLLWPA